MELVDQFVKPRAVPSRAHPCGGADMTPSARSGI